MTIPARFRKDADALPARLRALLDAELAAGNEIKEVGHSHPAPPIGATFMLARAVSTRRRATGAGLKFRAVNSSLYSGEFTDLDGNYFILEPPGPPPPEPDMDAIRAHPLSVAPQRETLKKDENTPLARFERSMVMDYEKWHDGIGYDLDALRALSPEERATIERRLAGSHDWRDLEALAELKTEGAKKALLAASKHANPEVRLNVARYAPELVDDNQRKAALVDALKRSQFFGGLSQAIDEVAEFHPPEIVEALFDGALNREGEVAVHFAALLMFIHGKAKEPFDMRQRPFFLRFNTTDRAERKAVFRELCDKIGVTRKID
jgi:hypothetical protein